MAKLNPYLNFMGNTEEAFQFYKSDFGGEFINITRFKDVPDLPGKDSLSKGDLNKIMHIALPIGDNMIMATDALESMGQHLRPGTNITLSITAKNRQEPDTLFTQLSAEGQATSPMMDMFWGDYWGMLTDRFGIQWMVSFTKN